MKEERPFKKEARILGIDDGPYVRGSRETPVIITVMRYSGYIDGFLSSSVTTDGKDSAEKIAMTIGESRFSEQARAILSDGACLAGFNVLDMGRLSEITGIPVITCSDSPPDPVAMKKALEQNFEDWEERFRLVQSLEPEMLELDDGPVFIRCCAISSMKAKRLVRKMTIRGRTPEPIRISHMIASEVYRE